MGGIIGSIEVYFFIQLVLISNLNASIDDEGDELIGIPERGKLGYHFQIKDSGVTFQWRRSEGGMHEMSMSSDTDGYVAVGFCNPLTRFFGEGMENCDIVIGWIENFSPYTPRIADLCSKSEGILKEDAQSDYELRPGSVQRVNYTEIKFKRNVDTEDSEDTMLDRPVIIIWAWNENDPVLDDSVTPNRIKIGTIIKHRSKADEVYQAPSRGHTPVTVLLDQPFEFSSASAIYAQFHLLVFSSIVTLCKIV